MFSTSDDNINMRPTGFQNSRAGRAGNPDNSRFVVNISGGPGVRYKHVSRDCSLWCMITTHNLLRKLYYSLPQFIYSICIFSSPKSTVVEMSQNQHQVSIIGTPRSKHKQFSSSTQEDTCPGHAASHVSRSYSSSSHVSHYNERTSPEGRSCGDVEHDSDDIDDKHDQYVSVAVHVDDEASTKYEDCSNVTKSAPDDVTSFSSCQKYQTPDNSVSQYNSPEELFADIGIKFIDCDETDEHTFKDDDTSVSSFSSGTYRTPSSTGESGDNNKIARDLSRELQETAALTQELAKRVDVTSLTTSDISGIIKVNIQILHHLFSSLQLSFNKTEQLKWGMSSSVH